MSTNFAVRDFDENNAMVPAEASSIGSDFAMTDSDYCCKAEVVPLSLGVETLGI